MDFKETLIGCAEMLDEKKAENTVILELKGLSSISDYFLITSAASSRQASALADYAEDYLFERGLTVHHKEGLNGSDWVVLDYMDFMIHIFNDEKRAHYNLDNVWKEAAKIYG